MATVATRSDLIPAQDVVRPRPIAKRHEPRVYAEAAADIARELARTIDGEVRFDDGTRALYATDLSMYRQVPIGVVVPRHAEDVEATIAACRAHDVPIFGRGTGTSLCGQCCNVAVVIDFSKYMNRIVGLDPIARRARVEPGVVCDQLRLAAEEHHLTFGPDPATHQYCTLGGMIGNNACGVHSVMAGTTADNVDELDVLLYDGARLRVGPTSEDELAAIIRGGGRRGDLYGKLRAIRDRYADAIRKRYPQIPRRVSGYNLDQLLPENGFNVARALVGTESTCAITLGATLRLVHSPPHRVLVVLGYDGIYEAADATSEVLALHPIALEAFHEHVLVNMRRKGKVPPGVELIPKGHMWLLAELGGDTLREATDRARSAMDVLKARRGRHVSMRLITDRAEQELIWHIRESAVGASRVPGVEDTLPLWEDSAVDPAKLGPYLRELIPLIERHGYKFTLFGHFGDGCLHIRIDFEPKSAAGVKRLRHFQEQAADLVLRYGGSLSGEHGDGQAKGELLPKMFGAELYQAFREFKSAFDPGWRMNPGKLVDAYRLDENLRTGPDYEPRRMQTHFGFRDDKGSFALATERCFGVGKCRGLDGGTMCPSFMATREEMHTTRGRAHLLFEMMRGDALGDGWRSEPVKEALDLCLACKGCKHECPVSVDMATYKAEFLSHYWEGRMRPMAAYAMGHIRTWARLAAVAPRFLDSLLAIPGVEALAKAIAGVACQRSLPRLPPRTFRAWFASRPAPQHTPVRGRVILWPDTFHDHFLPHAAQAAVEVLEAFGYGVDLPERPLCCGRPLYDYGMLDVAKQRLAEILHALGPAARAGARIVVLEPSCASVFRDELTNLFAEDEDAKRLAEQTFLLGELLLRDEVPLPKLERKAIVHGHCHQRAVLDELKGETDVLKALGLDVEVLDSGCCGMAGSFGYEKDKYEVSMTIGEQRLLPAIRRAPDDAIVVADGFSCREQIVHGTERRALHLAEVLQMAVREGGQGVARPRPEQGYTDAMPRRSPVRALVTIALAMVALAGVVRLARVRRTSAFAT